MFHRLAQRLSLLYLDHLLVCPLLRSDSAVVAGRTILPRKAAAKPIEGSCWLPPPCRTIFKAQSATPMQQLNQGKVNWSRGVWWGGIGGKEWSTPPTEKAINQSSCALSCRATHTSRPAKPQSTETAIRELDWASGAFSEKGCFFWWFRASGRWFETVLHNGEDCGGSE